MPNWLAISWLQPMQVMRMGRLHLTNILVH
jgi:hypothetical protein